MEGLTDSTCRQIRPGQPGRKSAEVVVVGKMSRGLEYARLNIETGGLNR